MEDVNYIYLWYLCYVVGLTAITCTRNGTQVNVVCPHNKEIRVEFANYGRTAPYHEVCPFDNLSSADTNCVRDVTTYTNIARRACRRRQSCTVDRLLNLTDACVGTYKYLEVRYQCIGEYNSCI